MSTPKKPMFSVIMPIHNKAPHIRRAVNSVLAQSFQDFELVLIDDASSDDSYQVMQSLTDPRISVYRRNEPGPGGYAGRNYAMQKATGVWAAFLDADDEWLPEHLERFAQLAQAYPDVRLMGAGWCTTDSQRQVNCSYYQAFHHQGNHQLDFSTYLRRCLTNNRRAVHTSATAVKLNTSVTPDLFPADKGANRGGDLFAWIRVLARYKKLAWSSHIGTLYHVDSVNMVTKTARSSPVLWCKESLSELENDLTEQEKYWLGRYFNKSLRNGWLNNSLNGHPRKGFKKGLNTCAGMTNYLFLHMFMLLPAWVVRTIKRAKGSL